MTLTELAARVEGAEAMNKATGYRENATAPDGQPMWTAWQEEATAALTAVFDWLEDPSVEALRAGEYDDGHPQGEWFGGSRLEASWQAMLAQMRREAGV